MITLFFVSRNQGFEDHGKKIMVTQIINNHPHYISHQYQQNHGVSMGISWEKWEI